MKLISRHTQASSQNPYKNLWRDGFLILLSVLFAFILVRLGVVNQLVSVSTEGQILGSFVAGIFFTSVFTISPASIALAQLSNTTPIFILAFWGALGAMVGDLILFLFIKDRFADDLHEALHAFHDRKLTHFFHRKFFHWLTPVVGALIIVSPLPDEMGISMLGVAKLNTRALMAISFVMNFIAVLLVAGVARIL